MCVVYYSRVPFVSSSHVPATVQPPTSVDTAIMVFPRPTLLLPSTHNRAAANTVDSNYCFSSLVLPAANAASTINP